MKKIFVCLFGCFLLALTAVRAQDTGNKGADSVIQLGPDTTTQTPVHSTISRDTTRQAPDTAFRYHGDTTAAATPASSPATRSIGDSSTPATATTTPATAMPATTPATGTTDSTSAANPQKKTPDTLITLTDAPNPQSTVSNDTLTTKKTQGGHTIEIKTVGATIDTTQGKDQGKTDAAANTAGQQASDTTSQSQQDNAQGTTHRLDPRWFIGVKGQFQDFAFLEKNREGYLSNANTLPFSQRGNTSVALSAYKNLTGRLSISADLGLSFGHVTSNDVLISQTKKMTFNLLNLALYYHLLPASYRLQPYVTVGFNDIINNGSYPCVPMGIGAKFNSKKVMVLGQVTYGQTVSHSIASTTMYSVGVYIPIKSKKYKNLDTLDTTPYNRMDAKKKDSSGKSTVINNIYVTINMDSILKAKGLLDDNGNPTAGNGRRGRDDGDDDGDDAAARSRRRKKPFKDLGLDDFSDDDYKIDSVNGHPVIRFVVYFEFNEYGLNSRAFNSIDKVIQHLRKSENFSVVEIKGYTDSVGSDPFNNMLSRRRAKMVLDYMNSRGIPTNIMKAQAYGRDNPVADNSDPNKAWLNRRAEIIIYRKSDLAVQ